MAKDPAFLFYYDKFLSGTFTMTDDQVGKYIRLLCIQANKGHITEKDMNNICKSHDEDIASKFERLDEHRLHNPKLTEVMDERRNYTESRRNNRLGRKKPVPAQENESNATHDKHMNNISKSSDAHMVNTITNTNLNTNTEGKGGLEEKPPVESTPPKRVRNRPTTDPEAKIFRDTPLFDKEYFKKQFEGSDYELANLDFYYEAVLNWSDSRSVDNDKGKKVVRNERGWLATARNFMLRDKQENKLQISHNAQGSLTNKNAGTGGRTYREDMFD